MLLFGCLSVRVPPSLSRREAMSSPLAAAAAASLAAAGSPWPAAAAVADGVTYDTTASLIFPMAREERGRGHRARSLPKVAAHCEKAEKLSEFESYIRLTRS